MIRRLAPSHRFLVPVFLLLIAAVETRAQHRSYPPEMPGARSETYKTVGETALKVWIFDPPNHSRDVPRPAIVFFFGGGWRGGSPGQFQQQCRYLADQGIVAMSADYRVSSRHQTRALQCVEDGKSVVRWIRQNADRLGIDPERIVAAGGSAGGHVAACTGVVPGLDNPQEPDQISSVPNALALFNPALVLAPANGVEIDQARLSALAARTGIEPERISPLHHLRPGLPPTIIFHGDQDQTVPHATVQQYARLAIESGNRCELVTYAGQSHGFFNYGRDGIPGEYYRLTLHRLHRFLEALGYLSNPPEIPTTKSPNVHLRSHFDHSRQRFANDRRGTVAFIGGSITEMGQRGHSGMVEQFLQQYFTDTKFSFVNAGISSTCSTTGAFRLSRDVLEYEPDLLFVEFAVNDDQDARHARRDCMRGMEGIIRQARRHNPHIDIVVTFFVNDSMLNDLQQGKTPLTSSAHDQVARHYGVATIDLAREVAQRIAAGSLTWDQYGGTHPAATGNRIAAELIQDLLTTAWSRGSGDYPPHSLPKPLDKHSYQHGRLISLDKISHDGKWTVGKPAWENIPGTLRPRFANDDLLYANDVGAEARLQFTGTAIGLYVLAGPDAGVIEYSIDGSEFRSLDLYHQFSRGLHYPRTVVLNADLDTGQHDVVIRIADQRNPSSTGNAVRILNLVAN